MKCFLLMQLPGSGIVYEQILTGTMSAQVIYLRCRVKDDRKWDAGSAA
jgi:hypothetical protein